MVVGLREGWRSSRASTPYLRVLYAERVRRMLEEEYGRETLYRGGLDVRSAVDLRMQAAGRVASARLERADRAQGYRRALWRAKSDKALEQLSQRLAKKTLKKGSLWDLKGVTDEALASQEAFDAAVKSWCNQGQGVQVGVRITALDVDPKTGKKTKRRGRGALCSGGVWWWLRWLCGSGRARLAEDPTGQHGAAVGWHQRPYSWLKVGDVVLVEPPGIERPGPHHAVGSKAQGSRALVAIDPRTRDVVAMIGGYEVSRTAPSTV